MPAILFALAALAVVFLAFCGLSAAALAAAYRRQAAEEVELANAGSRGRYSPLLRVPNGQPASRPNLGSAPLRAAGAG